MTRAFAALASLAVLTAALPAAAQTTDPYAARPGYGFNGAYQEMVQQSQPPANVGVYTYTPQGYVYSGPTYGYVTVPSQPAYTAPAYAAPPYATPAAVDPGPILSKDQVEDRLDDQGYDDIKVGAYANGYYSVRAKDKAARGDRKKVLLTVDARTADVVRVEFWQR